MRFVKIATAQGLLRKMAGYKAKLLLGGALVGGAHTVGSGLQKAKEYKAGFEPGYIPPREH